MSKVFQFGGRAFRTGVNGEGDFSLESDLRLVDPVLTTLAQGYRGNEYIAEEIFPTVSVPRRVFKYPIFGMEAFVDTRGLAALAKGDEANVVGRSPDSGTGETVDRWLATVTHEIDEEEAHDANRTIVSDADNALFLADLTELWRELDAADIAFAAGSYGAGYKTDVGGTTTQWNAVGGTPQADTHAAIDGMTIKPNKIVMSEDVHRAHLQSSEYRSALDSRSRIGHGELEAYWKDSGIEKVLVGRTQVYDPDTAGLTGGWSSGKQLLLRTPTANRQTMIRPSYGYTFMRSGFPKVALINAETKASRFQRIWTCRKPAIVGSVSAHLLYNAIA